MVRRGSVYRTLALAPFPVQPLVQLEPHGTPRLQTCSNLLPPTMKLGQGNIFSSMCQEFCPQLVAAAETRTVGKRAVRILLECFLVHYKTRIVWKTSGWHSTEMLSCCGNFVSEMSIVFYLRLTS